MITTELKLTAVDAWTSRLEDLEEIICDCTERIGQLNNVIKDAQQEKIRLTDLLNQVKFTNENK